MTEKKELPYVKAQMEEHGCQDVLKGHSRYPFQEGLILGYFIPEQEAQRLAAIEANCNALLESNSMLNERVKKFEAAAKLLDGADFYFEGDTLKASRVQDGFALLREAADIDK